MSCLARIVKKTAFALRKLKKYTSGINREFVAQLYLRGEGIEIGALQNPLHVPPNARVRYLDRLPAKELQRQYPDIKPASLVPVDLMDDGETLAKIPPGQLDFLIANHFIEHCQNPIGALRNMLRVLKMGGVLYLAVPDKRHTFDRDRPLTTLEHLWRDDREEPQVSRYEHYVEFASLVNHIQGQDALQQHVARLMEQGYSIHFHVWTASTFFEWLERIRKSPGLGFEVELLAQSDMEILAVLRKSAINEE
jgi:predicted SAM-dependent methyltransferase